VVLSAYADGITVFITGQEEIGILTDPIGSHFILSGYKYYVLTLKLLL